MTIKQLCVVERRGYKNWIVNVIDDDKVFVRSIGNIQEQLTCHCGKKVCGKCPFRQGLLFFQSWDCDAFRLMCRPVSSSIDMAPAYFVAWGTNRAGLWRLLWVFSGRVPFFWRGISILNPCYELWERSLPDLSGRIGGPRLSSRESGSLRPVICTAVLCVW